jgi:hypothetical protein
MNPTKKILCKVTQTDINKGCRSDAHDCPVARAVKRTLKVDYVAVRPCSDIKTTTILTNKWYRNPLSVQKFIQKFDREGKKKVKPFNFYLQEN